MPHPPTTLHHYSRHTRRRRILNLASEHVDRCNHCQDSIDRLGCSAMFVSDRPAQTDPLASEAECQFAIHRFVCTNLLVRLPFLRFKRGTGARPPTRPTRFLGELGSAAAMGTVLFWPEHDRLKRRCAIKLLPPARVSTPVLLKRFETGNGRRRLASNIPASSAPSDAGTQDGLALPGDWNILDGTHLGQRANGNGEKSNVADACEDRPPSALAPRFTSRIGIGPP